MKLVYIAGRFRGPSNATIQQNIDVASWARAPIAAEGHFPICVHVAEGLAMHDLHQENNGQWWIDATLEVLRRCDAVVVVPGWQESVGTQGEINEALRLGLPVYEAQWNALGTERSMISLVPTREWFRLHGFSSSAYLIDYKNTFAQFGKE